MCLLEDRLSNTEIINILFCQYLSFNRLIVEDIDIQQSNQFKQSPFFMQKIKNNFIFWCFSWSNVGTDDKGVRLTSNPSHTQTSSTRVPVCFTGEKNWVVRLNQTLSTGYLLIDRNTLETAEKENLGFYSFLTSVSDKLSETTVNSRRIFHMQTIIPWRNRKIIDMFSHLPSRITAESIQTFELEHNKSPFCTNDTFPQEHKQSQTSAPDD